jgi:hypothetical protein
VLVLKGPKQDVKRLQDAITDIEAAAKQ